MAKAKVTDQGLMVDLSGVEASERRRKVRIPEGIYLAKVDKVEKAKFNSGSRGVTWQFVITDSGKGKGARLYYNNAVIDAEGQVMENTLWSLRGVLQALEPRIKIPDKMMKIPFDKLVGRKVALEVADDEYEDKIRSTIVDVFHPDLIEEEEVDEEESDEDEEWDEEEDEDEDEEEEEDEDEWDLEEDEL